MEEGIYEIENNIDMFMDTLYENYRQSTVKSFEKAIKNLIARNKDLEEENILLSVNGNNVRTMIHMKHSYIPKSKVKEIIENSYPDIAVQKLYELLEGEK